MLFRRLKPIRLIGWLIPEVLFPRLQSVQKRKLSCFAQSLKAIACMAIWCLVFVTCREMSGISGTPLNKQGNSCAASQFLANISAIGFSEFVLTNNAESLCAFSSSG